MRPQRTDKVVGDLADWLIHRFPAGFSADRDQVIAFVELELHDVSSHSTWMFFPGSNSTVKQCDMPHNVHQFTDKGQGKHCNYCNLDYCSRHAINFCVKCGAAI